MVQFGFPMWRVPRAIRVSRSSCIAKKVCASGREASKRFDLPDSI